MREKFIELYQYNWWANTRVLHEIDGLTEDEFAADLGGSFSSISQTMNHILWVEWLFLKRWNGLSTEDILTPFNVKKEELRISWEELQQQQHAYFQTLKESALDEHLQYLDSRGQPVTVPLWQAIMQGINHSTFHRGQIVAKFRQLGKMPPLTDFIKYCREKEEK